MRTQKQILIFYKKQAVLVARWCLWKTVSLGFRWIRKNYLTLRRVSLVVTFVEWIAWDQDRKYTHRILVWFWLSTCHNHTRMQFYYFTHHFSHRYVINYFLNVVQNAWPSPTQPKLFEIQVCHVKWHSEEEIVRKSTF